jgi:hypothetical protein
MIKKAILAMSFATAVVNASTVSLDLNLIANYTFSNSADDTSGNLVNSIITGQQSLGKYGNGWTFSQHGDRIASSGSSLPAGNSARTISAWIKADAQIYDSKPFVLGGISLNNLADTFGIAQKNTGWNFWANGFAYEANIPNSFDLNWHHHILSFDGNNLYYYLDKQIAATWSGSLDTFSQNFYMGKLEQDNDINTFIGSIDEVRIYSRAITSQDEINALYVVPEPSALSLLAVGLGALAMMRRRS